MQYLYSVNVYYHLNQITNETTAHTNRQPHALSYLCRMRLSLGCLQVVCIFVCASPPLKYAIVTGFATHECCSTSEVCVCIYISVGLQYCESTDVSTVVHYAAIKLLWLCPSLASQKLSEIALLTCALTDLHKTADHFF